MEEDRYVYIFTRQDISPEQQLVQTAHAAFKLGIVRAASFVAAPLIPNPDTTFFVVVGVRDLEALLAVRSILVAFHRDFVVFNEPDLNNEPTSIATYPIYESARFELLAFNLLKF